MVKIRKLYYLNRMWYDVTYPSGAHQVCATLPDGGRFSGLAYVLTGRARWYRSAS